MCQQIRTRNSKGASTSSRSTCFASSTLPQVALDLREAFRVTCCFEFIKAYFSRFRPKNRSARVVKGMDLKPIVFSRAGSNPVCDGSFFSPPHIFFRLMGKHSYTSIPCVMRTPRSECIFHVVSIWVGLYIFLRNFFRPIFFLSCRG